MAPKTWLAIPAIAIACAAWAILAVPPHAALAIGALAAATAACVRAFAGTSVAAAVAAAAAALLAMFGVLDVPAIDVARGSLAAAGALFAIAELARPMPVNASPLPALGGAIVAATLDPSFVGLVAITGVRLVRGPWSRPRGSLAMPIAGVLVCLVAIVAACSRSGVLAGLWRVWSARAGDENVVTLVGHTGDVLGPIAAVAALAGIGVCTTRGRFAAAAVIAAACGALATDLACHALGTATPAIAAMTAGVAVGRLAATVRWPTGQAFVGAAAGFMIVLGSALVR